MIEDNRLELFIEDRQTLLSLLLKEGFRKAPRILRDELQYYKRSLKYRDDKIERLEKEIKNLKPAFEVIFDPCISYTNGEESPYVVCQNVKQDKGPYITRCKTKEEAEKFIETCKKEWGV